MIQIWKTFLHEICDYFPVLFIVTKQEVQYFFHSTVGLVHMIQLEVGCLWDLKWYDESIDK
jgi:hypothetical protein